MIKDKLLPSPILRLLAKVLSWFVKRKFNKIIFNQIEIKPNHSFVFMCNHFSFWDGILAIFLVINAVDKVHRLKTIRIMTLRQQMEKNKWLKYIGSFSVSPGNLRSRESIEYAIEVLNEPGNLLIIFPQGNLETMFIRYIKFKEGIGSIVPKVKSNCQLMWSSNFIEYFESLKPNLYMNLLDCGTNKDFNFHRLEAEVNEHHLASMKKNIRFTKEPE
ncbi:1-acyl-sn-glycerol-3-phosphate acyltransferase [Pedobacter sandarakinus]|uniref:1-acyl-sn-glycerol-3-phosphate acyltransferase n=1 Tax=Pedobacter sandarakinus TaxID=353156 RepID=UPI0022467B81|nr:1-acyl-sn-glycerol-3-phosphate acyltransferase [Pedobacter sandarakinus]MCX2574791.1 1-acyl-sn-glycerol-3-phosphate acyltransferase [Pedobacter sandarakinus]